jgi:hypothetical protein
MGERFLILEHTADALEVIDPELASHFRVVNGLPNPASHQVQAEPIASLPEPSGGLPQQHDIRMDVGEHRILADCSCGGWTSEVGWDEIDQLVTRVRDHVGPGLGSTEHGILAVESGITPEVEKGFG